LSAPLDPARIRAILLDIEGTTTPIDFVYGTLFPFARARLEQFLRANRERTDARADLEALRREHVAEQPAPDLPPWRDDSANAQERSALAYLLWLMDRDRKSTALKSLQGKIWEAGYLSGELRGLVYADVRPAFARWRAQNKDICIFSSGSVLAQKLLFANSTHGDLTPFLRAYFDTSTGPKQDQQSYRRIATALRLPPREILFLSDVVQELDAARRAGIETLLCLRPGATAPGSVTHPIIHSFDEAFP
jgi:enolase-phosphatase E1